LNNQKVVHISRAKRKHANKKVEISPPIEVNRIWAKVGETSRAVLVEANIRADMSEGDVWRRVLRKANFVLRETATAFTEPEGIERMVMLTIAIIRDYGAPEGVELLKDALKRFGKMRQAREAVSVAVARIGTEDDFDLLVSALENDLTNPAAHLSALEHFAERFPSLAHDVIEAMERFSSKEQSFESNIASIRRDALGEIF